MFGQFISRTTVLVTIDMTDTPKDSEKAKECRTDADNSKELQKSSNPYSRGGFAPPLTLPTLPRSALTHYQEADLP